MQIRLDSGMTLTGFSAIFKRSALKCLQSSTENLSRTSRFEHPASGVPGVLKRRYMPDSRQNSLGRKFSTWTCWLLNFHPAPLRIVGSHRRDGLCPSEESLWHLKKTRTDGASPSNATITDHPRRDRLRRSEDESPSAPNPCLR